MTRRPTLDQKIAECWSNGVGIGQTLVNIRRVLGLDVAFEHVRERFAAMAFQHSSRRSEEV